MRNAYKLIQRASTDDDSKESRDGSLFAFLAVLFAAVACGWYQFNFVGDIVEAARSKIVNLTTMTSDEEAILADAVFKTVTLPMLAWLVLGFVTVYLAVRAITLERKVQLPLVALSLALVACGLVVALGNYFVIRVD